MVGFNSCGEKRNGIITEKKSSRNFYVDWSQADNHHYFTKNGEEDLEETIPFEHYPSLPPAVLSESTNPPRDYWQLSQKLELALALIKKGRCGQEEKSQKRSMSNEPRK